MGSVALIDVHDLVVPDPVHDVELVADVNGLAGDRASERPGVQIRRKGAIVSAQREHVIE